MTDEQTKPRLGRSLSKNTLAIRTYAIPATVPESLCFSNHLMRFQGLKLFSVNKDLIWGVQGTTALNRADSYASMDAQHKARRVYQIELSYKLQGQPLAGTSVTEEFAKAAGYLHFSRLTSAYRKLLRDQMMGWIVEENDPETDILSDYDLEDLAKARPMLVHKLMSIEKYINIVIHTVALSGGASLRVATVRNIPKNIVRVQTRFHETIATTV